MLLAALALLLPQDLYQGAVYDVTVPSERLMAREASNHQFYVLEVFDPAAPNPSFPPMRVLHLKGETERNVSELSAEIRNDTRRMLKEDGATVGEADGAKGLTDGFYGFAQWFPVTDPEGGEWRFEFVNLRHGKRITVVCFALPMDLESERCKDILETFSSLEFQGFDEKALMQFNLFDAHCEFPLEFFAAQQQNRQSGIIEAEFEGTKFQLRASQAENAEVAAGQASTLRRSLSTMIKDAVEEGKTEYGLQQEFPTVHLVNGHSVSGLATKLWGHAGKPDGWRLDSVMAIGDTTCILTAVILESEPIHAGFRRFENFLSSIRGADVQGWDSVVYENDRCFRHDSALERREVKTDRGIRWEFRRRDLERAEWGELWFEIRDDLDNSEQEDVRAVRVRHDLIGEGRPSSSEWQDGFLFDSALRGVRSNFRDLKLTAEDERTMTVFSLPLGSRTIVAGLYGPWLDGPALRAFLDNIMLGVQSTKTTDSVTFEDAGVSYSFDPAVVQVTGGEDYGTSTARLRDTTITTSWSSLEGRLFGPPPPLPQALDERISQDRILWSLEGDAAEPVFGDASLGEADAKYAHIRLTLGDGTEKDYIYIVGDTAKRRLWVKVTAPVADTEAGATMTELLTTIVAK